MNDQQALWSEARRNAGLFSQYYLDEVLLPELREPGANTGSAKAADMGFNYLDEKFAILQPIILENKDIAAKRSEAQIEEDVIKKILTNVLGHVFDVQVSHKKDRPDYFLFSSEENKKLSISLDKGTKEFQNLTTGIVDAKAWGTSTKPEIGSPANISQIFRYLINFNKRWGVLTDGFRWMLFANKSGIRQDQYLQFDLKKIADGTSRDDDFRLFLYLFRREAFERGRGSNSLLDDVLDQSIQKAAKLQDDLKQKVYQAFQIVAEEYRRRNRLVLSNEAEIAKVKEASLIFLYRILFLLFGESRLILPVRPKTKPYYIYSLERLLVEQMDSKDEKPQPNSTRYWNSLNELFGAIHGLEHDGTPSRLAEDIQLRPYNGGLFDPGEYPLVAKWELGDKAIKEVTDLLTKTGETRDAKPVRVDYRDLGVQHLGNIYEGILENKLVLKDGVIGVVTDNGERKATGSYYTPDYIVDYIVEQTLEPVVEETLARVKKGKKKPDEKVIEEALLQINVLDPAMGSGHFLIGAIDYLATKLAEKGDKETKYTEAELQECRRKIAERCIYGVDLNPMAVELAKLSIWLHTLSESKPLTFLDNHIKWGNALIGARIADLQSLPNSPTSAGRRGLGGGVPGDSDNQSNLFPEHFLIQDVHNWLEAGRIFTTPSDDIADVKAKEALEHALDEKRKPYRAIADFWTSLYFTEVKPADASIIMRELAEVRSTEHPKLAQYAGELAEAKKIAEEKRFFHWELEFPEIFFDKDGKHKGDNAGWDVVMGNPPYGARLREDERAALTCLYPQTSFGNIDSYKFFAQKASMLATRGGRAGFIMSDSFLEKEYFSDLRQYIVANSGWVRSVRLGDYVFGEVQLPTALLLFRKLDGPASEFEYINLGTLNSNEAKGIALSNPIKFISATPEYVERLIPRSTIATRAKTERLIDLYDEVMGVKVYQRGKGRPRQSDDERLENKFVSTTARESWLPFISEGIYRYDYKWNGEYINYGGWLAEPREIRYFDCPKIVLREIVNPRPFATFINVPAVVKNTSAVFVTKDERYSLQYLLGLLNSTLFRSIIFERASKRDNATYPSFTSHLLKGLPIRTISFTTPKKTREKLTRQLITLSEKAIGGGERSEEEIRNSLQPVIELAREYSVEKSDVIHDFLAHLAEQMIEMNKEKQHLAEHFFTWMSDYGIPPRSEMKPKTKLDEFWTMEFKDVLSHLKKNVPSLPISTQDDLKKRFIDSSKSLNLLSRKIALTDWLIDQVVYALYGLTAEEIAIVEKG